MNCLIVLREALWAYIEYKRIPPTPRLGAMTIIPLTHITKARERERGREVESERELTSEQFHSCVVRDLRDHSSNQS